MQTDAKARRAKAYLQIHEGQYFQREGTPRMGKHEKQIRPRKKYSVESPQALCTRLDVQR